MTTWMFCQKKDLCKWQRYFKHCVNCGNYNVPVARHIQDPVKYIS